MYLLKYVLLILCSIVRTYLIFEKLFEYQQVPTRIVKYSYNTIIISHAHVIATDTVAPTAGNPMGSSHLSMRNFSVYINACYVYCAYAVFRTCVSGKTIIWHHFIIVIHRNNQITQVSFRDDRYYRSLLLLLPQRARTFVVVVNYYICTIIWFIKLHI